MYKTSKSKRIAAIMVIRKRRKKTREREMKDNEQPKPTPCNLTACQYFTCQ